METLEAVLQYIGSLSDVKHLQIIRDACDTLIKSSVRSLYNDFDQLGRSIVADWKLGGYVACTAADGFVRTFCYVWADKSGVALQEISDTGRLDLVYRFSFAKVAESGLTHQPDDPDVKKYLDECVLAFKLRGLCRTLE